MSRWMDSNLMTLWEKISETSVIANINPVVIDHQTEQQDAQDVQDDTNQ